jgi:hypothetical protein
MMMSHVQLRTLAQVSSLNKLMNLSSGFMDSAVCFEFDVCAWGSDTDQ